MKHQASFLRNLSIAALAAFVIGLGSAKVWAEDDDEELTLVTLKFFIEFNETDQDVGVQSVLGGEPYKRLSAFGPDGAKILELRPRNSLRMQGLSDFFFESAEPALDEVSMAEFLARFPEGLYEFETKTLDGIERDGETMFTHVIPAGPLITSPLDGDIVAPDNAVVTWEPVTWTTAFNPPRQPCGPAQICRITGYQVIVTRDNTLRVYSVDVPAYTLSITIPPAFLNPGNGVRA